MFNLGKYNQKYIKAKEQIAKLQSNISVPANSDLPKGQVLTDKFPVLDLGIRPQISKEDWKINIYGEVKNPQIITYNELIEMPLIDISEDFHCVTHWSKNDVKWSGVQFKYIASLVNINDTAKFVMQEGYDNYSTNLPLDVMLNDDVILAYKLFGQDLPIEHGGLVRMIVPSRYGWKGSKFLSGIRFLNEDQKGFWEERGYHNNGDYTKEERYS